MTRPACLAAAALLIAGCAAGPAPVPGDGHPLLDLSARLFFPDTRLGLQSQQEILLGMKELGASGGAGPGRSKEELADRLDDMGFSYALLGDHLLALAFVAQAAALVPDDAEVQVDVGVQLTALGHDEAAEEALVAALELDPGDPFTWRVSGDLRYVQGDYREAARLYAGSLDRVGDDDRDAFYGVIMLWLSQRRLEPAPGPFGPLADRDPRVWPGPVFEYLDGRLRAPALVDAVLAPGGDEMRTRLCEALFYVGERERARGNSALALRYMREVLGTRVELFRETVMARRISRELLDAGVRPAVWP